jgi:hypothetical protein
MVRSWKQVGISNEAFLFRFSIELDVHGSVHCNINLIERTNKMQPFLVAGRCDGSAIAAAGYQKRM